MVKINNENTLTKTKTKRWKKKQLPKNNLD